MSQSETEIFSTLKDRLRAAANDCDLIANFPQSGVAFDRMRKSLKIVENCCRAIASLREDARWLQPGIMVEIAHQKARTWLHRPSVESKKMFVLLAAALRKILADLAHMETAATGRVGIIVPQPQAFTRENRAIQVPRSTPSGLLVPASIH